MPLLQEIQVNENEVGICIRNCMQYVVESKIAQSNLTWKKFVKFEVNCDKLGNFFCSCVKVVIIGAIIKVRNCIKQLNDTLLRWNLHVHQRVVQPVVHKKGVEKNAS